MGEPARAPKKRSEEAELAILSDTFRPGLVRYFRRKISDSPDVDDLVQEVFLRLIRRGDVQSLEKLSGYVFQTASSVVQDWLRHRRSHRADLHEMFVPEQHSGTDFPADRVVEGQQRLRHATAVIFELPERTRNIFVLCRIEGMRQNDIAARLGISVSAVEKHLRRAVVHLMDRMREK